MFVSRWSRQRTYGVEIRADGPNKEYDGFICGHCGSDQDEVPPGRDPADIGALCNCCQQLVCYRCRGKGCMVLEYRLEQWERRNQGLRYDKREELYDIFRANGKVLK